jgi:succinate dehydrogenase/fumarate reductase flavoprotein subunit
VPIWFKTAARDLVRGDDGRVLGIVAQRDGVERRIRARRGVVLAGGGFPASAAMRERFLPQPVALWTPAFDGCIGETLRFAERAGGELQPAGDNALWFPSSIAKRADGSNAVFPHIALDRAKPGLIAVNAAGRRFVDEAVSYHEFVRAMYRSHQRVPTVPAALICDRRFVWKYGIGIIRPRALRLGRFIASGYLSTGRTLPELARAIGVDAQGLADTVARHNEFARTGVDEEFGKGQSRYDRANGDPRHSPNPCLGRIERPPYFAVAVFPTPLATSLGLRTNAVAQVLDRGDAPIAGLYACGNDMQSVMGGEYPGPGALIGPAMTFGYVAARDAARCGPGRD